MFRKRRLKREKSRFRIKVIFISLLLLSLIILAGEYLYLNFSFGRSNFISPIAKENKSKLAILESALDEKKITYILAGIKPDGSFLVQLKDGGEVILSSKKDIGRQLTSLQLILSRLTIEGKKLKNLDFRFDNPVVSF
jgi:hypothetical protein